MDTTRHDPPAFTLAGAALLALALCTSGCDRRDVEPVEPADSATSTIVDDPPTPGTVEPEETPAGNTGELAPVDPDQDPPPGD